MLQPVSSSGLPAKLTVAKDKRGEMSLVTGVVVGAGAGLMVGSIFGNQTGLILSLIGGVLVGGSVGAVAATKANQGE